MKRKRLSPFLIVAIVAVLGGIGFWGYKSGIISISLPKEEIDNTNALPSPSTTLSRNDKFDELEQTILEYSFEQYGGKHDKNEFAVYVHKVEGELAIGVTKIIQETGWTWIAKKTDGKWTQIWSGQGFPLCSEMEKYSVPESLSSCRTY